MLKSTKRLPLQQKQKRHNKPLHSSNKKQIQKFQSKSLHTFIKKTPTTNIKSISTSNSILSITQRRQISSLSTPSISNQIQSQSIGSSQMSSAFSTTAVHQMSIDGFSGKETSQQYDAIRPTYTNQAILAIIEPIFNAYSSNPESQQRPMRILDLGCGTGIFTRLLACYLSEHAAESIDYEIYSVDPNSSMVNVLKSTLSVDGLRTNGITKDIVSKYTNDKELGSILSTMKQPIVASVDELPYKAGYFDGIIAAQAFHWFCTTDALLSIQRCLTPNGIFSFCWNYWISTKPINGNDNTNNDVSSIPTDEQWLYKLSELIEPLYAETNTPHQKTVNFPQLFTNGQQYETKYGLTPPFGELYSMYLDTRKDTTRWMNFDLVKQRLNSISVVHTLPPERHEAFMTKVYEEVLLHPNTPFRINNETNEKEWPISFMCEVHYAQNSKAGDSLRIDPTTF